MFLLIFVQYVLFIPIRVRPADNLADLIIIVIIIIVIIIRCIKDTQHAMARSTRTILFVSRFFSLC
jgi:hypothetical protein